MRKILLLLAFVATSAVAQVKLQNVLIENRTNPVGLDTKQPRFSWQLVSDKKNVMQSAYEIKVTDESKKQVWSSGKVNSDQSVFVPYGGSPLVSGTKYTVQVKVWDNSNKASNTSEGSWQTAFFDKSDWKAQWIMTSQ
ncbi:MAG TPA: alpha-L-rhamnosidase, partial [Cyclobacteriaceae bacterium]